ncbi:MAG TPA: hypothetical protein VFY39_01800 [Gammaproteobacteria bacterium]|nr:hypothetical protein [Gammaproteobacteria bacterium]
MTTLYSTDGTALIEVQALERRGNELLIKGKVFGTMPLTAKLSGAELRKGMRLLSPKLVWFLVTLPFRRG